MQENYMVCHCKQVSYADIANALDTQKDFDSVLEAFKGVHIVIMEGYNFALSFYRLKGKIEFRINYSQSLLVPLFVSLISASLARKIFCFSGSTAQPLWLAFKMIFALSVVVFILALLNFKRELPSKKICMTK